MWTSRSTDVAPTSLEHVALLRAQIDADAAIVGSEHRQECRARAVSASTAAAEAGRRTGAMETIAQALDEAYANRVTPRLIVLLMATASCAIGISAEYAYTLGTLPGLLDIDPTSWSGVAVAAVPVAALTAIEWGLVALFAGEIRPFQRSLGGGRPRGALVAALGVIAVATAGVLVLWMNLQMVLDLGEVRGAASLLATDALASLESLAQAQAIVDRTARVIAVVAALDTALLLLVLQEEGRHAWSAGMLSLRRRLAARRLQDARVTLQAATVENDIAGASLASAEQSAALLVTAYRTRAFAELQARIDAASSARSAAEVFVDERLSRPPGVSAPLTGHTLVH